MCSMKLLKNEKWSWVRFNALYPIFLSQFNFRIFLQLNIAEAVILNTFSVCSWADQIRILTNLSSMFVDSVE